jgi:hypothetical protein
MSCREFEPDLVDLARTGSDAGGSEELRHHLASCPRCAARYRDERLLSEALGQVARAADAVPESAATEAAVLRAFHERRGAPVVAVRTRAAGWALAAAASLALVAAGWLGARAVVVTPGGRTPAPAAVPRATERAAAVPPVSVAEPAANAGAPARLSSGAPSGRKPLPRNDRRASGRGVRQVESQAATNEARFVALPSAESLPELESGMIVRVELPVSSLPAYGFPIMPETAGAPVTADVLVGQDGQPRAIRLVNMQNVPRRQP